MINSYEIIEKAVKEFWKHTSLYACDVIAFFYQKYECEDDNEWEWCEELVECHGDGDFENTSFLNDFCEGQTCVKDITIVPLDAVADYYSKHKLEKDLYGDWSD